MSKPRYTFTPSDTWQRLYESGAPTEDLYQALIESGELDGDKAMYYPARLFSPLDQAKAKVSEFLYNDSYKRLNLLDSDVEKK